MPRFRIGLAIVVLLSATALAFAANKGGHPGGAPHGGAPHGGGAAHFSAPHMGGGRPSFARSFSRPAFRGNIARSYSRPVFRGSRPHGIAGHVTPNIQRDVSRTERLLRTENSRQIHNALNSHAVRTALNNRSELRNPRIRSLIAARMAEAGWHHGNRSFEHGWWRHRHGGFGWIGPLFWPFAYYDWYDYALWGYDDSFWDYGYGDIYAALFSPYDYDDLAGYLPQYASTGATANEQSNRITQANALAQMCGEDTRDIAGIPADQIRQSLQLDDQQQTALDNLAAASAKAAQTIKAACPTDITLTAPGRLDAMQQRLTAIKQAVDIVQPALDRFYGLLSDEQKAKLTALNEDQRRNSDATGSIAQDCASPQAGLPQWPTAEIDQDVHPTGAQRAKLDALQNVVAQAADRLAASCPNPAPLTPPARLASVAKRLDLMLQNVRTIRAALNDFYGSLSDEQKAQFDAIGPQQAQAARG